MAKRCENPKHAMHNKSNIESVRSGKCTTHPFKDRLFIIIDFFKSHLLKNSLINLWVYYRALTVTT